MTNTENTLPTVRTAFLVYQHPNGSWEATSAFDLPLVPEHQATVLEMKAGCAEVHSDIRTSEISAMVVQQMMAVTAQLSEQAKSQAVREKLKI